MKISWLYSAACAVLLSAPAAQATSVFTDYYDANGILLSAGSSGGGSRGSRGGGSSTPSSDSWTFDITTDGFDPNTQSVISATIDLNLRDDNFDRFFAKAEFANLTAEGGTTATFSVDTGTTIIEVISLVSLNAFGTLDVTLTATKGDFYFDDAKLNAVEYHHPAAVPVPAAVWLFGSGLLGLVAVARRKTS